MVVFTILTLLSFYTSAFNRLKTVRCTTHVFTCGTVRYLRRKVAIYTEIVRSPTELSIVFIVYS